MGYYKNRERGLSRRTFLKRMQWAPTLFLPAPLQVRALGPVLGEIAGGTNPGFHFADLRFTPHYPAKSPLDEVLRKLVPGTDEYVTERYAFEIMRLLEEWSRGLKAAPPALGGLAKFLDGAIEGNSLAPVEQRAVRSGNGIEVLRRRFGGNAVAGREAISSGDQNLPGFDVAGGDG